MNVLFVTSWFPSKYHPKNGNFVETHAHAFLALGHNVVVVHEEFSNKIVFPRIEFSTQMGLPIFQVFIPRLLKSNLGIRKYLVTKMLKKHLEVFDSMDVVQGQVLYPVGQIAQFLASRLNAPLFFTEHWSAFLPESSHELSDSVLKEIQGVARNCKTIMPVSIMLERAMRQKGIEGNYKVISNPVDTSIFKMDNEKKRQKFTFLHVSNFSKGIKNVDEIMRAFDQFKAQMPKNDAQLIIAGDGNLNEVDMVRKGLKAQADIELIGALDYAEVASLMQSAHCFVLFSSFETFGLVAAEALCCGIPIIVSDAGALLERDTPELGLSVKSENEPELTHAMGDMVSNYERYSSSYIQEYAQKKYSFEAVASSYLDIYNS